MSRTKESGAGGGRKLSDSGAKARFFHAVSEAHLSRIIKVDLRASLQLRHRRERSQSGRHDLRQAAARDQYQGSGRAGGRRPLQITRRYRTRLQGTQVRTGDRSGLSSSTRAGAPTLANRPCNGLWRCTWWWHGALPGWRLGRTCPELDAAVFFDADETRGEFLLAKKPRPKTPTTPNQIIRLIASLGGFSGRQER